MAVHDPEGVLDPEWVNARGAIARFVRDAIEIRVIDTQEHPGADLAIAALTVAAVRSLVEERHVGFAEQLAFPSEPLEAALLTAIRDGERAPVDERLARVFGVDRATCAATVWRDVWRRELQPLPGSAEWRGPLEAIFEHGPLARRVLTALERGRTVWDIYHELCECLRAGKSFIPA
jgi:gamma-glutamyl:cysteine ligase YbdK (ATP-grasp superfamily)